MATILIVDDNPAFRKMLKHILLSRFPDMKIWEAQDGNRAFKNMEKQAFDLVFMDVRLPGKNGFDLTKGIKAAFPETAVIVMTSYDLPEYRETAFESGADIFISKNKTSPEDILEKAASVLTSRGPV